MESILLLFLAYEVVTILKARVLLPLALELFDGYEGPVISSQYPTCHTIFGERIGAHRKVCDPSVSTHHII